MRISCGYEKIKTMQPGHLQSNPKIRGFPPLLRSRFGKLLKNNFSSVSPEKPFCIDKGIYQTELKYT
jgi:hypothetical protein